MKITKEINESLKAHFLSLYKVACCDNNFHELELKMLYDFAKKRGISEEHLNKTLLNPIDDNVGIPENTETRITYLYELCLMIWADGVVDENELSALKKYIRHFEFEESNVEELAAFLLHEAEQNKPIQEILNQL